MTDFHFVKCHGSGNDFILINELDKDLFFDDTQKSELAIKLCNRVTGIGADGILLVQNSKVADAKMRIFNADGSEASMCGNGLRCVARFVSEKLDKHKLMIETNKAILAVEQADSIFENMPTYQVEISPISFDTKDVPMNTDLPEVINKKLPFLETDLSFSVVAVPNPHLISFVPNEIDTELQQRIAEKVNGKNQWFPDGINVSFVKSLGANKIFVQTYERGVGFTNACGTAMSASSLLSCILGINHFDSYISVYNPGGFVKCVVDQSKEKIALIGNATYEFYGKISFDLNNRDTVWRFLEKQECPHEKEQYAKLQATVSSILP